MPALPDLIHHLVEQHPTLAEHFPYLLVFTLLYLSGIGLPLPEEVSLILGGYLVYVNTDLVTPDGVAFPALPWAAIRMMGVASAGILAGDLTVYGLGWHYGQDLLSHRWARWILSNEIRGRVTGFYGRWGHWAVFISRFVAGIRVGSFFLAGASRVRLRTFLLMDGLGTLLSVPISVWLAYHFGEEIKQTLSWLAAIFRPLAQVIAIVALAAFWWQIRKARKAPPAAPAA